MSNYTDDKLRAFSVNTTGPVRDFATELLAARARVATLEQEVRDMAHEIGEAHTATRGAEERCEELHAKLAELDGLLGGACKSLAQSERERDALRAKLAEYEPRPLREGDEWAFVGQAPTIVRRDVPRDPRPICRILRIPIPAAPESAPAEKAAMWVPRVGDQVRVVSEYRSRDVGVIESVDAPEPGTVHIVCSYGRAVWARPDELELVAPAPPPEPESAPAEKAPRWKRGDRVRHWRYGLGEVEAQTDDLAAFVRFDERGSWPSPCHYVKPDDLAAAPEPINDTMQAAIDAAPLYPMTEEELRANPGDPVRNAENWAAFLGLRFGEKQPEPPAEGADVSQLRFIAGMGATARVSVRALSACMSRKASEAARMMAVEIAERRLAEMPTLPPAEGAGEIASPQQYTAAQIRAMFAAGERERPAEGAPGKWNDLEIDIDPELPVLRSALLSIVRASNEVDTVRKAAMALLGEEGGR